jgi:hypothetical protein
LKRMVGSLLCFHEWQEHTTLGVGAHERTNILRCLKCGKVKTLWSGKRGAWRLRHGYDTSNTVLSVSGERGESK